MMGSISERLENLSPAKRALLELRLRGRSLGAPLPIQPRRDNRYAALSPNQESLFFLDRLNPNASTYNLAKAVKLTGQLDLRSLQMALDRIVSRHESLRTSFHEVDGETRQVIDDPRPVKILAIDLSGKADPENKAGILDVLRNEANRPLDLYSGPLFRTVLIRTAPQVHYLLVIVHHIVSDGWSLGVFWREFYALYTAYLEGGEPEIPRLPIQFGDYAEWARVKVEKDFQRQTEYWKEQLQGAPALLELPADRPRPAVQSFRGSQQSLVLRNSLTTKLRKLSQQEGVTLFMTLLAGFGALLSRYTGNDDIIIGSPIAGRNRAETENLIGFFVNTVALRMKLNSGQTFRELLSQVKNSALEAFSNQELPFEKVVAAINPERSLSHNLVYQVAFALETDSGFVSELPGLELDPVELGSSAAKFDLFLSAREEKDGLRLVAEFSSDLFDEASIQRLLGHLQNLLESATQSVNRRISDLQLLSQEEENQVLIDWNQTASPIETEARIHDLMSRQAAKRPEAIAVSARGRQLSYRELDRLSNQIARYLLRRGHNGNKPVGLLMERSIESVAAMLGILKAGGCYLPLDPSYPASRLNYMLEVSKASLTITTRSLASTLPDDCARVVIDEELHAITSESAEPVLADGTSEDLAYLMFTSGSTGNPKGTLIPHRAINRLVTNTNYVEFSANDRIAHLSNISFDAATFEIWGALLNGGELVVIDREQVLSPPSLMEELKNRGVDKFFLTTALFNLIARQMPETFNSFDTVVFGGEACDPAAIKMVLEAGGPRHLVNGYGPTETTTFAICHEVREVSPSGVVPIGRPISNTTVFILDRNQKPVPVGVPGEIYIGGEGVAKGYLASPELTAERFVNLQFGNSLPVTLYRTGDIARYRSNGEIEYIGRRDHQIKMRGFRIELGEIEAAITSLKEIRDCIVQLRERNGEKYLVAFFVPVPDSSISASEVRRRLSTMLPEYMVPARIIEIENVGLNSNGKLDRSSLPPDEEVRTGEVPTEATDELEIKLTWIWEKVLGVEGLGIRDNFFECGGHSLTAVRLFSEIEKAIGCHLPLATLFQAPTIEALAGVIRAGGWQSRWQSVVPLRAHGTRPPFFCVHAVGGNVLEYHHLAGYMESDQPFFGIQSLGLDGRSAPLTTIEEMATAYIAEMKQVQPTGPYYLGGRSFGGTVAFEMARQLQAAGEEVALLAMLDSYPIGWLKLCEPEEARQLSRHFKFLRLRRHVEIWSQLSLTRKVSYGLAKVKFKTRKLKNLAWRISQKLGGAQKRNVDSKIRLVEETNYMAVRKYVPGTYAGTVTFFCALEEVSEIESITGWNRLATGGVEVVRIPGDHQTMIEEPHVRVLAEKIGNSIRDAMKKVNHAVGKGA